MTRIYVAETIGSGIVRRSGGQEIDDSYRSPLVDLMAAEGDKVEACIQSQLSGPDRGKPALPWTVCIVNLADYSGVTPDMVLLADMDDPQALRRSVAAAIRNGLAARGVSDLPVGGDAEALVRSLFDQHYSHTPADGFLLRAQAVADIRGGSHDTGGGVIVSDHFTDTNGVALQSHTPDIGGAWEAMDFSGPLSGTTAADIQANRLESAGSTFTASRSYRNAAAPSGVDYDVSAHVRTISAVGQTSGYHELHARMTPTGTAAADVDRYAFRMRPGSAQLNIYKVISASFTSLVTDSSGTVAVSTEYDLLFEITDALKKGTVVGLTSVEHADNDITQVGRAGLKVSGTGADAAWMDDYLVSEAAGPTIVTGALPLSGEGSLAATGRITAMGALALSGTGTLAPVGHAIVLADLPLSGAGALDFAGTRILVGALALTGTGSLDPVGQLIAMGALSLTGEGLLEFAGEVVALNVVTGSLPLSGAGDLDAVGELIASGALPLSGQGDMTPAGIIINMGALPLAGAGDLDLVGALIATAALPLDGAGDADFSGELVGEWLNFGQVIRLIDKQVDKKYRLVVALKSVDGATAARGRLFNITDGAEVVGSEVSTTSLTTVLAVGSFVTLSGNKLYRVQTKGSA